MDTAVEHHPPNHLKTVAAAAQSNPDSPPPALDAATVPDASSAKAVRLIWCDTAGIRRCRVIPGRRYTSCLRSGVNITSACMAMPAFADVPVAGAGLSAVGEARMVPVADSRVELPWCPGHQAAVVGFETAWAEGPWECCPRHALQRTCSMFQDNFGLTLRVGFELEFLLLQRVGSPGQRQGLYGSGWAPADAALYCQSSALDRQAAVLDEMVAALEVMGIEVLQWHAESAHGQFEIALGHCHPLKAADQLILAREALVGVAGRHNLAVSFLPKPVPDAAGNGCHVHMSLWKDGRPHTSTRTAAEAPDDADPYTRLTSCLLAAATGSTFTSSAPPRTFPTSSSPPPSSNPTPEFLSFLAGVLAYLPHVLLFTAPCPNSYKRMRPGAWAGAHAAWGFNNREVPLRVTAPGPGRLWEMRLEVKCLDHSANPYLALAALTVAGMLGLSSKMMPSEPCQVPPGDLAPEAVERLGVLPLPSSLEEALDCLQDTRSGETFQAALTEAVGAPLLRAHLAVRLAEAVHAALDLPSDLLLRYS